MNELIQYILGLFTDQAAAQAFVSGPGQAMVDNGLVNVAPDEFSSALANAMPGVNIPAGDPIGGLQQVLTDQYGFDPGYGYDQGYGGYDQGYGGYGLDPVSAVLDGGAALVGDAVAPVVDGAALAADVGAVSELLESGAAGVLIRPGDAHGLASAARDLLRDPVRRDRLSLAARASAERFRWETVAREHLDFLRGLAGASGASRTASTSE